MLQSVKLEPDSVQEALRYVRDEIVVHVAVDNVAEGRGVDRNLGKCV